MKGIITQTSPLLHDLNRFFYHFPGRHRHRHRLGLESGNRADPKLLEGSKEKPAPKHFTGVTYNRASKIEHLSRQEIAHPRQLFSVKDIEKALKKVWKQVAKEQEKLEKVFRNEGDHIQQRLLADRLPNGTFQDLERAMGDPAYMNVTSVSAFTLDFELDFHGETQWQGRAVTMDLHMELHLEQVRASSATIWQGTNDSGMKTLNARTLDTGRYLISFLETSTLEIHDKLSSTSTAIMGDPFRGSQGLEAFHDQERLLEKVAGKTLKMVFSLLDGTRVSITPWNLDDLGLVEVLKDGLKVKGLGQEEMWQTA